MSLRAYQQAAQRSETPRDVEYRLFAQVTRALMDV
ncbi:MAG TPA: flagellar biosynthesis regulator FlaF, partial [Caulobacteraceae bacterium]|nr:flagellar biosynthesis regulator FlaF [Caulobacteraceae bacterium]